MLEYIKTGQMKVKAIDLLDLDADTNLSALVEDIASQEALITDRTKPKLLRVLRLLQARLAEPTDPDFYLHKLISSHQLPLTNFAIDKPGKRFATGSYDRTCKIWNTNSGEETHSLEGHENVVYCLAFNNPYGDKIASGSFDKTARLWDVESGQCFHTFRGHTGEIVCLAFDSQSTLLATGSMDRTARLWDIASGDTTVVLSGHTAEIIAICFTHDGSLVMTASFDNTSILWDVRT
eukprot:UC1_evm2s1959